MTGVPEHDTALRSLDPKDIGATLAVVAAAHKKLGAPDVRLPVADVEHIANLLFDGPPSRAPESAPAYFGPDGTGAATGANIEPTSALHPLEEQALTEWLAERYVGLMWPDLTWAKLAPGDQQRMLERQQPFAAALCARFAVPEKERKGADHA